MKTVFIAFLFITGLTTTSWSQDEVSATRQVYLQNVSNINYQLQSIDNKWTWLKSDPTEDSIAIAQGWYDKQAARREQLMKDLVTFRYEQLASYYQQIIDFSNAGKLDLPATWKEINENRSLLAPSFPPTDETLSETESAAIVKDWIASYEKEYELFTAYLENLVLTYS
jgi:hypothetical protein